VRFRKKPVEIEARQTGPETAHDVLLWIRQSGQKGNLLTGGALEIYTLEGAMRADVGDWIIRGVQGEFYPCKPDIFAATYEPCEP
jgi:hypothetical protein